jgi:fructokinase
MRIGIDLGGTKIEAIALAPDGREIGRLRRPTPRQDYEGTVSAIVEMVREIELSAGHSGTVGVGIPGTVSRRTGLVMNANSVWLIGRPLESDLAAALNRPVRMSNDANCFAVSEAADGAATGASVVFGVILGTGVGGGIVLHGRPLEGANGIAGEWGHNPLPDAGRYGEPPVTCWCGRLGCIESYLSGPAFAADHKRTSGKELPPPEIVAAAMAGERAARFSLERYVDRLALSLGTVVNLLDPDIIVLGGGMSEVDALYREVPSRLTKYVFVDRLAMRLVRAKHGPASGVRGAAWLWPESDPR